MTDLRNREILRYCIFEERCLMRKKSLSQVLKQPLFKKKYAKSHSDVQETSSIFHRPGNEIDFPM